MRQQKRLTSSSREVTKAHTTREKLLKVLGAAETTAALALGAIASAAMVGSSQASPQQVPKGSSGITVVLVHGLWADGSCYSRVIPLLLAAGHTVYAPQLPLTSGLQEDVTAVLGQLQEVQGPTVLVGHSYGGAVITQIGTMLPNVIGLVYASAIAPELEEPLGKFAQGPGTAKAIPITYPNNGGTYLAFHQQDFQEAFAADVDSQQAALMAIVQKPANVVHFTDVVTNVAWKGIPSWSLLSEQDRIIPPDAQQMFATRMHASVLSVPSSHASIVSHPEQIAALVQAAITASASKKV
jgi:pimeloyl-ACP methyl ester carboxylesterase